MMVQFMPWAGFRTEVRIGPVTIWPYASEARARITDTALREHLNRYFACYVDQRGQSVSSICVCTQGAADFRELSNAELSATRSVIDLLIFAVIYPATVSAVINNNNTFGPASADRYQLLTQCFTPGNDHVAVRAGSLMSGGWRMGEIKFPQPWSMGGHVTSPEGKMLGALAALHNPGSDASARERIFRSLEWFRMAHTEVDEVSQPSKIVMMATALEILLSVPNVKDKSGWIRDTVEKHCRFEDSREEGRRDREGDLVTRTKVAWWAWDFYKLRNHVVHGAVIRPEHLLYRQGRVRWLSQLIVADLLFGELVVLQLLKMGLLDSGAADLLLAIREDLGTTPSTPEEELSLSRRLLDIHDVHRATGWVHKPAGDR